MAFDESKPEGKMKEVIGVIGLGVVGSAVADCFKAAGYPVAGYDKFKNIGSLGEVVAHSDVCFVAVPTATDMDTGAQDLEPLMDVLARLDRLNFTAPIVIKCTVVPGTMDKLKKMFPFLTLLHQPEFLTEANAKKDFMDQDCLLLSGPNAGAADIVLRVYREALPKARSIWVTDYKATELAKYIHNCFLAVKVAVMNEFYDYAVAIGTDYDSAVKMAATQGRIGESHLRVPGPDGKRGFGGMCFPKDTLALVSSDGGSFLSIITRAILSNKSIRGQE
jgi:UDPglucose 6-dehydrogenase